MNISSWEIITLLFHKWGKAGGEERNAAGDHRLSRNPAEELCFQIPSPDPRISLNDLPLLTGEFMGASGELLTTTGTFSQSTQPPGMCSYSTDLLGGLLWGEGSVGNGGGEGTPGENFQRWKYFPENTASVCRRCRYNWPSVLSWSWEWIFYRKKEMHGCGAASSKGSFQATCHGAVYRHKSQKGWSRAVERVWFVGCGAWHLAPGHADLTQSARATPLHTVVSGRLKWKEQKEKALIRGAIKTEPGKKQKNSDCEEREWGKLLEGKVLPSPCPSPNLQQLIKLDLPSQRTYRSDAVKSSEKRASPSWLLG